MNNDTNNASTDPHHQWLHYYQQNAAAMPSGGGTTTMHGFSDTSTSTIVTTSVTTNNTTTTSRPSKSPASLISTDDHAHLNPQTTKPIRRRSRAPRRTPTTLLNASTTNFRSLVQQFTGCQNIKSSSISYGSQKGPVNLSFGNQNNHHQMIGTSSRIAPLGSEIFYNQPINPVVHPQQQQQQQMYENLQVNNIVDNNNMQSDGLVDFSIDDVSDLHELMDESSSFSTGDNKQDGSYYF